MVSKNSYSTSPGGSGSASTSRSILKEGRFSLGHQPKSIRPKIAYFDDVACRILGCLVNILCALTNRVRDPQDMTPPQGAQLCHSCRNIFDRRSLYGINPATETCHEGCECSACRIYPTTHCIHESLAALCLSIQAGCWVCSSLPSLDAWAAHSRLYVVIDQLSGGTRRTPLRPFFYYLEFRITEDATGASQSITAGEFVMAIRLDPIPSWTRAHDLASASLAQS